MKTVTCAICGNEASASSAEGIFLHSEDRAIATATLECSVVLVDKFGMSFDDTYYAAFFDGGSHEVYEQAPTAEAPSTAAQSAEVPLYTFQQFQPIDEATVEIFDAHNMPRLGGSSGVVGWSSISTFQKCPYLWQRQYLGGLERIETAPFAWGGLMHTLLALHYYPRTKFNWVITAETFVEALREKNVDQDTVNDVWRVFEAYRLYYGKKDPFKMLVVEHLAVDPATGESCRYDGIAKIEKGKHHNFTPGTYIIEHKCLSGDTRIFNYATGQYHTLEQLYLDKVAPVVAAMAADGTFVLAQAKQPVLQPQATAKVITTKAGRQIIASDNHPFWTRIGWVPAADLVVGGHVAAPREMPHTEEEDFSDAAIKLIGYMLADGSMGGDTLQFTKNDATVMADFVACAASLGDALTVKYPRNKAAHVRISAAGGIHALLKKAKLLGLLSDEKHIPNIKMSTKQCRILLGALWSTDGCVSSSSTNTSTVIIYGSRSRELCAGICDLLQRVGIVARVRDTSIAYRGNRRAYHHVKVITRESKRKFLELALAGDIPVIRSAVPLDWALENIPTSKQGADNRGNAERHDTLWWDEIESIATTEREIDLYDIEVPGPHTFVAEGIVTHNSAGRFDDATLTGWANNGEILGQVMLYHRLGLARVFGELAMSQVLHCAHDRQHHRQAGKASAISSLDVSAERLASCQARQRHPAQ